MTYLAQETAPFMTLFKQSNLTRGGVFVHLRGMANALSLLEGETPVAIVYPAPGRVAARYGIVAEAGFQPVPDVLLFHQSELGVRSEDLNVLLNITAHWYFPERMPYPHPASIAKRMGVSVRTVQRSLTRLRKLGLLGKSKKNAEGRMAFDITPLVEKLQPLAKKRRAERSAAAGLFGMA
jgi:hypothetical protein